jgi:cytochrome oxidase assembly protein ShyY1
VKRFLTPIALFQTALMLTLVALSVIAFQWQWHKGQVRSHQNSIIRSNLTLPVLKESKLIDLDPTAYQWREVSLAGNFDQSHILLLRNRYFEGKYGFEVLTLFHTNNQNYWIDRGWVSAGANAKISPRIPALPNAKLKVIARIRADDITRQVEGTLFALPGMRSRTTDLATAQGATAAPYYLDLISSNNPDVNSLTPIVLPDLTNGPHFAYAIQWLAFATLFLIGRILLFRETK